MFPFVTMSIRKSIPCFYPQNYICLHFIVCLNKPSAKKLVVKKNEY